MVGVIPSSSKDSSSVSTDARVFDVGNDGDILQLLNFIRTGEYDEVHKNEMIDIVLDFVQTKDVSNLTKIILILKDKGASITQNGTPLEEEKQVSVTEDENKKEPTLPQDAQAGISSLGSSRPQPAFAPAVQAQKVSDVAVKIPVKDTTPPPNVEQSVAPAPPEPATLEQKPDIPEPVPVDPEPLIPPIPPKQTAPQQVPPDPSVRSSIPPVQDTASSTIPPTVPEPETVAIPPEQTSAPATGPTPTTAPSDPLSRIKEIKRLVNDKVGNPVNLIDANNTIGREYMNSLLNAMKRINGGTPEEVTLAMDRLEKAYQTVEQSIQSGETVIGEKQIIAPAQPTTPEPNPVTPPIPPVSDTPSSIPAPVAPGEVEAQAPEVEAQAPAPVTPPVTEDAPPPPPEPIKTVPTPPKTEMQKIAEATKLDTTPAISSSQAQPVPVPENTALQPNSLAEILQKENTERESLLAAKAAELEVESAQNSSDPLQSNEISAGLQQLLSEWKLFKSSGIFGTGAGGYEHPLYKIISAMPMAAVIAGRFEGATPEIKQSIADYMNGWRYEQNVVHEMSETFEHYLRRVIQEVLARQKKAPTA